MRLSRLLLPLLLAAALPVHAQVEGQETKEIGKPKNPNEVLTAMFPPGSTHEFVMIPMRDGVKLATDIFVPPGDGKYPTIFARGFYGRFGTTGYAKGAKEGGLAFICQDSRGCYDSEGKGTAKITAPDYEMNDVEDTLKWIASQKWSNGKIGMMGASGNGVGPSAGYMLKSPLLVASMPSISAANPYYYFGFQNHVRRGLYAWLSHTGLNTDAWPKPSISTADVPRWQEILKNAGQNNSAQVVLSTGWYDIASEATLDAFAALAPTSHIYASISPNAHSGNPQFPWPRAAAPAGAARPALLADFLKAATPPVQKSQLVYYLLGNFRDPSTGGNIQKITDVWPVPNTSTSWYLQPDGTLSETKPTAKDGSVSFDYDPKDPAPTLGGNPWYDAKAGPYDQRPLASRKDVVRFISAPLEAPLEITGKILADLYISTDVPDTLFVVKFIDIHPDGYEMIIREGPAMGRYAEELQGKPAPLVKDKVYQLKFDLWSTAILLAKGHRLGVLITSSSKDAFEVHPNSFEPVTSYDKSPIAHQKIYASADHPSRLILPVVTSSK